MSDLTLNDYQKMAETTAIYREVCVDQVNPNDFDEIDLRRLVYSTLGLAGEAGEIANKVKKIIRDNDGLVTRDVRTALRAELGDVLWYVACLAGDLRTDLSTVAQENLDKLAKRAQENKIQGSGDNR